MIFDVEPVLCWFPNSDDISLIFLRRMNGVCSTFGWPYWIEYDFKKNCLWCVQLRESRSYSDVFRMKTSTVLCLWCWCWKTLSFIRSGANKYNTQHTFTFTSKWNIYPTFRQRSPECSGFYLFTTHSVSIGFRFSRAIQTQYCTYGKASNTCVHHLNVYVGDTVHCSIHHFHIRYSTSHGKRHPSRWKSRIGVDINSGTHQ